MLIEQTDEEKASHFASIGFMNHANYYATLVLIKEIKKLNEVLVSNV